MFIRFDMIHERDRQTDTQTDRHRMTAIAALMHSIARQNGPSESFSIIFGLSPNFLYVRHFYQS